MWSHCIYDGQNCGASQTEYDRIAHMKLSETNQILTSEILPHIIESHQGERKGPNEIFMRA